MWGGAALAGGIRGAGEEEGTRGRLPRPAPEAKVTVLPLETSQCSPPSGACAAFLPPHPQPQPPWAVPPPKGSAELCQPGVEVSRSS